MRERTTWQSNGRETPRQAATFRRAEDESAMDIYNMHGKRVQPKIDTYDLDSDFAEGVVTDMNVSAEYDGKKVKRNEIGMGEFREDTFKDRDWSKPKYENTRQASERKAIASHRLASTLLRSEDRTLVRKVAVGFMGLSEKSLTDALRAVDATKPEALDDQARFKRAYACTKLAASMLGEVADEPTVERLARQIYRIDDPTLKSIVKTVASARVAADSDAAKGDSEPASSPASKSAVGSSPAAKKASGPKSSPAASPDASSPAASPDASSPAAHKAAGKSDAAKDKNPFEKKQSSAAATAAKKELPDFMKNKSSAAAKHEETAGWDKSHAKHPEEGASKTAEEMIKEMLGPSEGAMPSAPAMPSSPASQGGMPQMKSSPAMPSSPASQGGMPQMPSAPAPMMSQQSSALGISFDDDETPMTVHTSALEALFADDPEVKAQREITAANREAAVRSGYNFERTASSKGAKKLGNVQSSKEAKQDVSLEMLWDRP